MTHLSSAAWIAHDVGLAASIGGTLFGKAALHPALNERLDDDQERMLVADAAWRRFGWLNLAAHGVFAATWFIGRGMLSGKEVTPLARKLTMIKDGLVVASLISGVASVVLGRMLGKKTREMGRQLSEREVQSIMTLRRAVGMAGLVNLISTASIHGVTTQLAMEGNKSGKFSLLSRILP